LTAEKGNHGLGCLVQVQGQGAGSPESVMGQMVQAWSKGMKTQVQDFGALVERFRDHKE